jgi:MYXO-CTERM domain-containing protein
MTSWIRPISAVSIAALTLVPLGCGESDIPGPSVRAPHMAAVRAGASTAPTVDPLVVDAIVWLEQSKVMASDGASGDQLGESVAVDGDRAVIGAHMDDDGGMQSGSAYVFERNGATWSQVAKLKASDAAANDRFGSAVAVQGDTIVVGALGNYDAGGGAAYVFVKNGSSWVQQTILTSSDLNANWFGAALSLSGNSLLVGAPATQNIGAGYVFVWNGSTWSEEAKLTVPGKIGLDLMGISVGIDADTAVLGDPNEDDAGTNSGAAYVFTRNAGVWSLQAKLTGPDSVTDDVFGGAVSVRGDTVMAGAIAHDFTINDAGAVYVFDRAGGTWPLAQKLTTSVPGYNDWLGSAIAIDGDLSLIGARGDSSAYIFERTNGVWAEALQIQKSSGVFGRSVSLSGDTVAVGAPLDSQKASGAGAGYLGVVLTPAGQGAPCTANAACISGYCVDGVCCDSACGGGAGNDCEACSVAAGSASDGVCSVVSPGVSCRPAAGACDVAESCDGVGAACPADGYQAAGLPCRPVADDCDVEEACDGMSAACPADGFQPAGTVCRTAADDCDVAEACKGTSGACPVDAFAPAGTACRVSAGDCDVEESCSGMTAACPVDALAPAGTVCRTVAGDCDIEETCDGGGAACPADSVETAGTECRAAVGDCDLAEQCSGIDSGCPADAFMPDGSACDDANGCTAPDACAAGACVAGMDICTGQGGSSSSSSGNASSAAATGAGGSGGAGPDGDTPSEPAGCGCRMAATSHAAGSPLWLLALAAFAVGYRRIRV